MKKYLLLVMAAGILASCSAPKYAYHFDHYDYNSGKKKTEVTAALASSENQTPDVSPLVLQQQTLVARADEKVTAIAAPASLDAREAVVKRYAAMSKIEQKVFRKEAKAQIKKYVKAVKSGDQGQVVKAAQEMDHDLKFAAIFGAVGFVSLIIGGDVFWVLGGISLLIGVIFFVVWLAKQ